MRAHGALKKDYTVSQLEAKMGQLEAHVGQLIAQMGQHKAQMGHLEELIYLQEAQMG